MQSHAMHCAARAGTTVPASTIDAICSAAPRRINGIAGQWSAWWDRFAARRARKLTAVALSELSTDLLQDIGAPASLRSESAVIRESRHNRRAFWLWS